ncbi:hypothetical protein H5410_050244 [Solanum commersonii]|uniref:Uncharacterized protein n=1 Tax=Solanum commersonii TaxID=4109 RepID=A0A9J5WUX7_SOLCO|nr:hypothetical protein H5410_050244 [Solanum commersonii]
MKLLQLQFAELVKWINPPLLLLILWLLLYSYLRKFLPCSPILVFFEEDLPEGRGPKSSILAAGAELVAAQSLTSLRGVVEPTFSEQDDRSQEQVSLRNPDLIKLPSLLMLELKRGRKNLS